MPILLENTKEDCTGSGACWTFIKIWLNTIYVWNVSKRMKWRINTTFILLIGLVIHWFISLRKI